jgi:hypothetical protein
MSNPGSPLIFGTVSTLTSDDNVQSQNEQDISSHSQADRLSPLSLSDTDLHSKAFHSRSPLAQSLISLSNHPNCPAVSGFFDNVAVDNQPRRLASMPDSADYFVDTDGQPILLVFPAELDFEGKYSRVGSYFNLPATVSYYKNRIFNRVESWNSWTCI